jgi:hypothetical protein
MLAPHYMADIAQQVLTFRQRPLLRHNRVSPRALYRWLESKSWALRYLAFRLGNMTVWLIDFDLLQEARIFLTTERKFGFLA